MPDIIGEKKPERINLYAIALPPTVIGAEPQLVASVYFDIKLQTVCAEGNVDAMADKMLRMIRDGCQREIAHIASILTAQQLQKVKGFPQLKPKNDALQAVKDYLERIEDEDDEVVELLKTVTEALGK